MYNSSQNLGYPPNLIQGMNNLNVYDENRPVNLMQVIHLILSFIQ